jgi:hypothetical protein
MFEKATPILVIAAIEPCLPFWERLGFAVVDRVAEGDRLGFAILVRDDVTLMLQTVASLANDLKGVPVQAGGITYINVADLTAVAALVPAEAIVVPRRTTFYGAEEIFVREPGGNLVAFAKHPAG